VLEAGEAVIKEEEEMKREQIEEKKRMGRKYVAKEDQHIDKGKEIAKEDREQMLKLERKYDSFGMPDWQLPFQEIRAKN
tara:strand:+ start:491 stop:727 length:237 start_codon:yes stop_codon:yes gene_type:complete